MRKLIVAVGILAVIVVAAGIADVVVRHHVEGAIATQIDDQVPGSHAQVTISSFPFVGRLAASGSVPTLAAHVTGVQAGPVALDTVDVVVHDIRVARGQLVHGKVQLESIREAVITAQVSQASLDHQIGVPVTIGAGTVGLAGVQVPARLGVVNNRIDIQVPPLPAISVTIPLTNLVPCIGAASLSPGRLTVTCTTDQLPPALDHVVASF
ncbi:MAG: hypothetical protein M3Y91_16650 [Actinomycetota bacterium]|nr:hypothetical protein [Actinomycetota bacterium]